MNVPRALFSGEMALFVFTMLIRRCPVRITPDPLYWFVTLAASYYGFLLPSMLRGGVMVAPGVACNAVAIFGVSIAIFARVSLGRNIGLVPGLSTSATQDRHRRRLPLRAPSHLYGSLPLLSGLRVELLLGRQHPRDRPRLQSLGSEDHYRRILPLGRPGVRRVHAARSVALVPWPVNQPTEGGNLILQASCHR